MDAQNIRNNSCNIMCRLCLASDDNLLAIFDEKYTFLPQRIAACVNVEIYKDDKLPKTICKACFAKVESWFDFKKCCDDSQSKLRQWASINSIICNKSMNMSQMKDETSFFDQDEVEIVENDLIIIKEETVDPVSTDDYFPLSDIEPPSPLSEPQPLTHESINSLLVPTFECPASVHGLSPQTESKGILSNNSDSTRKCRECFKEFSTVRNRIRHENTVHRNKTVVDSDKDVFDSDQENDENIPTDKAADSDKLDDVTIEQFAASLQLVQSNTTIRLPVNEKHFLELNKLMAKIINELKCLMCGLSFKSSKNANRHISKSLPVERFSCFDCCIAFPNRSQFMKHCIKNFCKERYELVEEKSIKAYQHYRCSFCGELYVHISHVGAHLIFSHYIPGPTHPRCCQRCEITFNDLEEYKNHLLSDCFYKIYCSICKDTFSTERFKEHSKIHDDDGTEFSLDNYIRKEFDCRGKHDLVEGNEMLNKYSCSTCGEQFPTLDIWCEHQKIHEDNINRCGECNRVFVTEHDLEEHKSTHNNNIKLKLYRCSSTNAYKAVSTSNSNSPRLEEINENTDNKTSSEPQNDLKNTVNSKKHNCFCGKSYPTAKDLERHKKQHAVTKRVDTSYIKYKRFTCPKCKSIFRRVGTYRAHRKVCIRTSTREIIPINVKKEFDDSQGNGFSCKICNRSFETERGLSYHSKYHNQETPLPTHKSERKLSAPSKTHFVENESSDDYVCYICNKSFDSERRLLNHNRIHFTCPICNKSFDTKRSLNFHNTRVHGSAGSEKMECQICHKIFPNVDHLIDHLQSHADKSPNSISPKIKPERDYFNCSVCNKEFSTHKGLKAHEKRHLNPSLSPVKVKTEPGLESFNCNFCNTVFASRSALNSHIKVHLNGMNISYNCTFCTRVFTNSYQLTVHVQAKHSDDSKNIKIKQELLNLRCTICKKSFASEGLLQKHLKIHAKASVNKKHKCNSCFQTLPSLNALSRHVKANCLHCVQCDRFFNNSKGLTSHQNYHRKLSKGPFNCTQCNSEFKTQGILSNHLKVHKQLFKCNHCPKSFSYLKTLTAHCATAHGGNVKPKIDTKNVTVKQEVNTDAVPEHPVYRCTECNTTFVNSKQLRVHVLSAHIDDDM